MLSACFDFTLYIFGAEDTSAQTDRRLVEIEKKIVIE